MRDIRAVGAGDPEKFAVASRLDTLEDVLRAGFDIVEVIVQDEYCHDVVTLHARGKGPAHFVVFDTT